MKKSLLLLILLITSSTKVYAAGNWYAFVNHAATHPSVSPAFKQCIKNSESLPDSVIEELVKKKSTVFRKSESEKIDRQIWSEEVFRNYNAIVDCTARWSVLLEYFEFDLEEILPDTFPREQFETLFDDYNDNFYTAVSTFLLLGTPQEFKKQGPWAQTDDAFGKLIEDATSGLPVDQIVKDNAIFQLSEQEKSIRFLASYVQGARYDEVVGWWKEILPFIMVLPSQGKMTTVEALGGNQGNSQSGLATEIKKLSDALNCGPLGPEEVAIMKNYNHKIWYLQHDWKYDPTGLDFRVCKV